MIHLIGIVLTGLLAACTPPVHNNGDDLIEESIAVISNANEAIFFSANNKLYGDQREESLQIGDALFAIHNADIEGYHVPSRFISQDYAAQLDSLTLLPAYQILPLEALRNIVTIWRTDLHRAKKPLQLEDAKLMRALLDNQLFTSLRNSINDNSIRIEKSQPYVTRNGNILFSRDDHNNTFLRKFTVTRVQVVINGNEIPQSAFSYSSGLHPFQIEIDLHHITLQDENIFQIFYTITNTVLGIVYTNQMWEHVTAFEYYNQIKWN